MNRYLKMIPCSAVLVLTVAGASAQTTAPATSQPPTAIGVSPQTAAEAERKAIPRSDTGTVVRTAPSAADQTRSAVDNTTGTNTGRSASGTLDTNRSTADTTTTTTTTETNRTAGASGDSSLQTAMRRPRADRN